MFETILDEEERGQVGIGTLIVFIAMVLVAAIAAGVLINTAGFLQTQAEATGEESTSQVSDRLQVVSQSGNVTAQEVDRLDIVVAKAPGAGNIDLNETSVEIIGADGQESFKISDEENASINMFTGDPGDVVLIDNSDRAELSIELGTDSATSVEYDVLQPGEDATVTFTTASGATTTTEIRVPTTLTDNQSSVRL
ncbi:flagellin [Halorubrum salipaludis]|uniref:Flagellin n=1 Tax=Halorubrum salipaludis TaxID=2032630 RepID=A0A2A2FFJ1_9EURY|nr:archaellin/type IV pilin N-terminal domain-containing protein [Halorubrum salipaludis]PAU83610.1 flagellin [Halorubrum salipaludis]